MASPLAMASNLVMASNLLAMAFNLLAMASNLPPTVEQWPPNSEVSPLSRHQKTHGKTVDTTAIHIGWAPWPCAIHHERLQHSQAPVAVLAISKPKRLKRSDSPTLIVLGRSVLLAALRCSRTTPKISSDLLEN